MISQAKSVDEFLDSLELDERIAFKKVRTLLTASPKVEESMKYRMPTYMVGAKGVGGFNKQKHYLCVYLNPAAVDPYRGALKSLRLDCGKSCIRFTRPEQMPLGLLKKIIANAIKRAGG
ncbi:MAG: hypothetical protein JWM35_2211 [Verrucomicrobia bacterium]|nr:hypothetical protein [Verrucomicrobiota bacterium]